MAGLERNRERGQAGRRVGAALAGALLWLGGAAGAEAAGGRFAPLDALPIPENRLFDLGATDYDGNGLLDVFTTNHKFHPALLRNEGTGAFTDVTGPAGFSQAPDYPGLELLEQPLLDEDGVYIYVTDSDQDKLPGVVHILSQGATASGRLTFTGDGLVLERADNAQVEVTPSAGRFDVDFDVRPGSVVDIRIKPLDVPFSVEFDPPPPAQLPPPFPQPVEVPVFVGTDAVRASSRQLLLTIRDRHGYAFADLAGDGAMDAFAVSGGLGGEIELPGFGGVIEDELLIGEGGGFANVTASAGLIKGACRGRQAAAVDADADGMLDLFESCEGKRPQIYGQTARGSFTQLKSPPAIAHAYRWVELGGSARPELLAALGKRGVQVLQLGKGGWKVRQTIETNGNGQVAQFALDDIDSDGDLDVLAVSGSGNTMLRNDRGRLEDLPLGRIGLPRGSVAASFVDYDNDGRDDLHLVPQGILRKVGKMSFRETGSLSRGRVGAAVTSWPDLDNDGLRDPIVATGDSVFAKRKEVDVRQNRGPGGHWLEVDLVGTAGNAQAIGAMVSIGAGKSRQYQWVGQNDDSHFSQGHYRTYFGLGKRAAAGRLIVDWPDGSTTRVQDVAADQVLRVSHP